MGQPEGSEPEENLDHGADRSLEGGKLAEFLDLHVQFAPDADAPPIDYQALSAFACGQLDDAAALEVAHHLATYHPWHDAMRRVLEQQAKKSKKAN